MPGQAVSTDVTDIFHKAFVLDLTTFIPAIVLLAFIFLKQSIRFTMIASTFSAVAVCWLVQGMPFETIFQTLIFGFEPDHPDVARMLSGGGLVSMLPVCVIILISSTYAGLLEGTGLIARLKRLIPILAQKVTPFGAITITAIVSAAVACNQVLAVMLTNQLCSEIRPNRQQMAIDLENTAIVIAPLIPWSIAGAVPIASIGAPTLCIAAAFYLWFLPLWHWLVAFVEAKRTATNC